MEFVDLFAGLGGFHYAAAKLGHKCVFACEKDPTLRKLYSFNHNMHPDLVGGDIADCKNKIPPHDLLLAGFPCQSFSKSGKQLGFKDEGRGDLVFEVLEILRRLRPKFFVIENVGNFPNHNSGLTWLSVHRKLIEMGYSVRFTRPVSQGGMGLLSPHQFGYPQRRERFFAIGATIGMPREEESFPIPDYIAPDLSNYILDDEGSGYPDQCLSLQEEQCIEDWNKFISSLPNKHRDLSGGFPLWLDELGAEYPFLAETPYSLMKRKNFSDDKIEQILLGLPPYAREKTHSFPRWKVKFILQNREWLSSYSRFIPKKTIQDIASRPHSYRKLEWNYKAAETSSIWDFVFQFRPSGIRVSNPSYIPTVVAIGNTQTPVYGPLRRRLHPNEIKKIFGFPEGMMLPQSQALSTRALGNAVHVCLASMIIEKLTMTNASKLIRLFPDAFDYQYPLSL
jgi:DNA (cytosine-5)-methyltransferase 1